MWLEQQERPQQVLASLTKCIYYSRNYAYWKCGRGYQETWEVTPAPQSLKSNRDDQVCMSFLSVKTKAAHDNSPTLNYFPYYPNILKATALWLLKYF